MLRSPISSDMAKVLAASVQKYGTEMDGDQRSRRAAQAEGYPAGDSPWPGDIEGIPEGFSFHDLRHYFASAQIA